jgi:hypothetical protein
MRKNKQETEKIIPSGGEVLIYKTDNGKSMVNVRLVNKTLWLTQSDMAQLFQCPADKISLHLKTFMMKLN